MVRKLVYLFNPISGTAGKASLLKKIESATKAQGLHYEFMPTNAAGDYTALRKKIEQEHITDVIIIGGDGSVNQVTGSLRGCAVMFGIIPAGSGNGLAFAAGIPKNTDKALAIIFNRASRKTDAFLINGHYACMLSGVGFDAAIAHKFAMQPSRGLTTYVQQSIKHFFKAAPYTFEIVMNDASFFRDAYFISIANSNQFGNNVTIAPKAKLNDGLLDIVIVQKMSKAALPLIVWKQISGNNPLQYFTEAFSKKGVLYFQTEALIIKNPGYAPLHIDGEPYETAAEFKIEIIKDCFELLQP